MNVDTFLGLTSIQWTGVNVVLVAIGTLVVVVTIIFLYVQVRQASRSLQFAAVNRLQEMVDSFHEDRSALFMSVPISIALTDSQFAKIPPGRHTKTSLSEEQIQAMQLTEQQLKALSELNTEQIELGRRIINKLNDIGQLVEDGFIPKDVFYGKYHLLLLRCCHMLEPIRRRIEERQEGGNYGHRMLRIRSHAAMYHDIHPKHRDVSVYVSSGVERILIYKTAGKFGDEIIWSIRRYLRFY